MSGSSVGSAAFTLAFQLSPILFSGGIATGIPGGLLPIVAITESVDYVGGLLSGSTSLNLNNFFANFQPMPGGELAVNDISEYPFANQQVAGNAIIVKPCKLSMLMICPTQNNYLASLITMEALVAAMSQHELMGGVYNILTPKQVYPNMVHLRTVDVSTGSTKQAQNTYQMDFYQPLLTVQAAQSAQNQLMSQLTNGTQIIGQP